MQNQIFKRIKNRVHFKEKEDIVCFSTCIAVKMLFFLIIQRNSSINRIDVTLFN